MVNPRKASNIVLACVFDRDWGASSFISPFKKVVQSHCKLIYLNKSWKNLNIFLLTYQLKTYELNTTCLADKSTLVIHTFDLQWKKFFRYLFLKQSKSVD